MIKDLNILESIYQIVIDMKINGLTLFRKGIGSKDNPHYVIAAWHNPMSITWSWLLWWYPVFSIRKPFGIFHYDTQDIMLRKNR